MKTHHVIQIGTHFRITETSTGVSTTLNSAHVLCQHLIRFKLTGSTSNLDILSDYFKNMIGLGASV